MSEQFTIKAVGDPREWESQKYGDRYYGYPLDLEDANGKLLAGIESNRKLRDDGSHNKPSVGDVVIGEIKNSQFGEKLSLDYNAMKEAGLKGGSRSGSTSGSADYKARSNGKSPDQQASIVRQHSQEMAVRVLAALGMGPAQSEQQRTYLRERLKEWTDFFEADANAASASQAVQAAFPGSKEVDDGGYSEPAIRPATEADKAAATSSKDDDIPF